MPNDSGSQLINPVVSAMPVRDAEFSLSDVLHVLRAGWKTILTTGLIFLVVCGLYVSLVAPTYEANGIVQVEENAKNGSMSSISDISSLLLGSPVETEAEIQLLQSRLVLDQVIDEMNLLVVAVPKHFPIIGGAIARAYEKHKENSAPRSPLLGLTAFAWGGEAINVKIFEVPSEWVSAENFGNKNFEIFATGDGFLLVDPDGNNIGEGHVGVEANFNTSAGGLKILVSELRARPGTRFTMRRMAREDVLKNLMDHLTIAEQGKQSGVIGINFTGRSPTFVKEVVNNVEGAYLKQNIERRSQDAKASLDFLEQQLPELKSKVDSAQAKLNVYQVKHGSVDVTAETQLALQQTVDLETQRLQLIQQRDEALQRFTVKHPVILALNQQIATIVSAQQKLQDKEEMLPKTQQEVFSYMRDLDVATQLYTQLLNTIQELQVAKAGTIGNVRIVDYALQPISPSQPKVPLFLGLSIFLGCSTGALLNLVRKAMMRGVNDAAEVEQRLGITTYAAIPFVQEQRRISKSIQRGDSGMHILAAIDNSNPAIEAIRSLRTSLHFALMDAPNNVIMLTGPAPNMGKSFLSVNLGAVLAMSGKRAVVVDADLRRGQLNKYIGVANVPGLADYVAGDADKEAVIKKTGIEGLAMVCRGTTPPNPAELLLHERFDQLIGFLSTEFDYVIVDAPPVLVVTDPAIIGRLAGTTLMVLKAAEHPMREIEETVRRLVNSGIKVRGALFNQVGFGSGSYGYGNYGYGYKYYRYERR